MDGRMDYNINDLVTRDDTYKEKYVIVEEYPEIDYVLVRRDNEYQPWVAAWNYQPEIRCWGQGHYFGTLESAMEYIRMVKGEINYYRMTEIASKAIDGLFEVDPYGAEEWLEDELDLTEEESKFFCIAEKREEYEYEE